MTQKQPDPKKQGDPVEFRRASLTIGPVPDPESLQRYEEIQPGFAERLIAMAEKEQLARHEITRQSIEYEHNMAVNASHNFKRGQLFAIIAVLLVIALCGYAFYLDHPMQAAGIAIAVIVALAASFLGGKQIVKGKEKP